MPGSGWTQDRRVVIISDELMDTWIVSDQWGVGEDKKNNERSGEGDIEVWVVDCSLCQRWAFSAGREGNDMIRVAGDGAPWPKSAVVLPECISDSRCAKQR